MRTWRLLILTFLIAAILPAQAMGQKPKLAATLLKCSTGATQPERALTVSASMPALTAPGRMWMRFELYEKIPGPFATFKRVKLPAWNPWTKSQDGVSGLVFERTVDSLNAPAAYKTIVRFRWYDATGQRIKARVRTTKVCIQPTPALAVAPAQ
jgi:hypothetical protein